MREKLRIMHEMNNDKRMRQRRITRNYEACRYHTKTREYATIDNSPTICYVKGAGKMATEVVKAIKSQIQLDNGTDEEGRQKTVNIALSGLSSNRYDADKYLAIVGGLEPCLSKPVYDVLAVKTSRVTAN